MANPFRRQMTARPVQTGKGRQTPNKASWSERVKRPKERQGNTLIRVLMMLGLKAKK